jgi:hypothetical protein
VTQDDLPPCRGTSQRCGPTLAELAAALPPGDDGEPVRWSVVPIDELPYQHLPFKCDLRADWAAALAEEHPDPGHEPWEDRVAFSARWFPQRTAAELARCSYHGLTDWRLAAELACEAVTAAIAAAAGSPEVVPRSHILVDQVPAAAAVGVEALLFSVPILWSPGSPTVDDGQHRICALRGAGAANVPVAS